MPGPCASNRKPVNLPRMYLAISQWGLGDQPSLQAKRGNLCHSFETVLGLRPLSTTEKFGTARIEESQSMRDNSHEA